MLYIQSLISHLCYDMTCLKVILQVIAVSLFNQTKNFFSQTAAMIDPGKQKPQYSLKH